jgi:hypothetical protein
MWDTDGRVGDTVFACESRQRSDVRKHERTKLKSRSGQRGIVTAGSHDNGRGFCWHRYITL